MRLYQVTATVRYPIPDDFTEANIQTLAQAVRERMVAAASDWLADVEPVPLEGCSFS